MVIHMSTLELIEDVLRRSGPFTSEAARTRHRRWLAGHTTDRLEKRRLELLATERRPVGQRTLTLPFLKA